MFPAKFYGPPFKKNYSFLKMEAFRLFLTPTFKEIICSNLTFEETVQLRDALKFNGLKCQITVIDPKSNKKIILPGVNSTTIATNELIKQHGLDLALLEAAQNGKNAVVQTLLTAKDIDVNVTNRFKQPALMRAAVHGHNSVVQTLLTAKDINVNATDTYGQTTLMLAVRNGHNSVVQTLLTVKDIDVNATDERGLTALMVASAKGYQQIVETLKAAGAH